MFPPSPPTSGAGGVVPRRAEVVPRGRTSAEGASLPLEHHVRGMLGARVRGNVNLWGPAGAGKSVALGHLAEVFRDETRLIFVDCNSELPAAGMPDGLRIFTSHTRSAGPVLVALQLSPWGDDDLIEYLVSAHRVMVASVMKRVAASPDRGQLGGLPEVWRIALDVLAADETLADVWHALRCRLWLDLPDDAARHAAGEYSFSELICPGFDADFKSIGQFEPRVVRLIRHRSLQLPLAAGLLANELRADGGAARLAEALPLDLQRHTAEFVRSMAGAVEALAQFARNGTNTAQANAAAILHAMGTGWRPDGFVPHLAGAHLSGAQWPGILLADCAAAGANFMEAGLEAAHLERGNFARVNFARANLQRAILDNIDASGADFTAADLRSMKAVEANFGNAVLQRADLSAACLKGASLGSADLRDACAAGADFSTADLQGALIDGADFAGADFTSACLRGLDLCPASFAGACFVQTNLLQCHMEYMTLPDANFQNASLGGALFTGSIMPRANFRGAHLCNTGLADIEWEGACLRDADLRGASFHAGTTRSGLVGSTIASEGTRTGFYTDDFNDRDFKSPEEIRKANLRGADLLGAKIDNVDFYLVDLRDARYSKSQAEWFRKCGAILRG